MNRLGPEESGETYKYYKKRLLDFLERSFAYALGLDEFHRYIIWRYTIGSGAINNYLIMGDISINAAYWCFLFFKYAHNTDRYMTVPTSWISFRKYIDNPLSFQILSKDQQNLVASQLIPLYIKTLEKIIIEGPRPSSITVYKASSRYPGIPLSISSPWRATACGPGSPRRSPAAP